MIDRNERPRRAGQARPGPSENAAGSGVATENSTAQTIAPPHPLVIERGGLIRFATADELRRIARLGMRGALA